MHAALANGRINRHLGTVQVNEFLGVLERGELDGMRHACLHAEPGAGGPSVPRDAVTRERAAWLVALAGEVLADIQFEPGEWGRVLTKVDAFEQAAGIQEPVDRARAGPRPLDRGATARRSDAVGGVSLTGGAGTRVRRPKLSAVTDSFPRQYARTQRFTLGEPRDLVVSPDGARVVFARSRGGSDPVNCLWVVDVATGDGAPRRRPGRSARRVAHRRPAARGARPPRARP